MKSFRYFICLAAALVIVSCIFFMKGNPYKPKEAQSISIIINKLQRIQEAALSHAGEKYSNDDKIRRLIGNIIAEDVDHPSEISCLATALYDLRAIKTYEIRHEDNIKIHSEYPEILENAFWQCVLELSTHTDPAAMDEMERLCHYLDGLGVYDAGNALLMIQSIESQQWAASKERGEKTFWRTDSWTLENRWIYFRTIKSCYWQYFRQSDTIRGEPPLLETEITRGFIEVDGQKEGSLLKEYSWSEVDPLECWFDPPKSNALVQKFDNAGRFLELQSLSETGTDDLQGRIVLNATSNIICFDLRVNQR